LKKSDDLREKTVTVAGLPTN